MDKLVIKDLEIYANHGLFKEEKVLGQKFLVSLEIFYSMSEVAKNKNLEYSIDYGKLCHEIVEIFKGENEDLIETCAYKIVEFIFKKYKIAERVIVSIKKPWAPINLPLNSAEVVIDRKKIRYFVGIGTNLGDREENIKRAIDFIGEFSEIINVSSIIETKAWGVTGQPNFLNGVIEVKSFYEPEDFLKALLEVEKKLGRVRDKKWGPRIIDLDILFADGMIIYSDILKVPHPYIEKRDFVLKPLQEIAPFFVHPVLNKKIIDIKIEP